LIMNAHHNLTSGPQRSAVSHQRSVKPTSFGWNWTARYPALTDS
jgi:hypothetical protein